MDRKGQSKNPYDRLSEKEEADHSMIVAGPEAHAHEKSGASPSGKKAEKREEDKDSRAGRK